MAGFGLQSIVVLATGVGLILVAVLLMVIPGPGLLVLFFGLGIIASEILLTARFMIGAWGREESDPTRQERLNDSRGRAFSDVESEETGQKQYSYPRRTEPEGER